MHMRRFLLLALGLAMLTASSAEAQRRRSTRQPAAAPTAAPAEAKIVGRIQSLEKQLDAYERVLQQQLAKANKLRTWALQKNDYKNLEKAEAMERQAVQNYERQLKQFEVYSRRLAESTEKAAEQKVRSTPVRTTEPGRISPSGQPLQKRQAAPPSSPTKQTPRRASRRNVSFWDLFRL